MTLRRTAIQRKTELRRTGELNRGKVTKKVAAVKRTVAKQRRQRDTGPTPETKALLWERAKGRCELCGVDLNTGIAFSRHHRRPRGSGGSTLAWVNEVTNLLLVCGSATTPGGCHRLIESNRAVAYGNGWLVSMNGIYLPAEVPVLIRPLISGHLVYLTESGHYAAGAP